MPEGDRPRVSVIVCVDGFAPSPAATISSCLSQAGVDLELLVVHDGTAEQHVESIRELSDPRVRILAHPAQGRARSLDLAVGLSSGEWLKALMPDEILLPGALARELRAAESAPGVVGVLAPNAPEQERDSSCYPSEEGVRGASRSLIRALLSADSLSGGGALLRRSAVRRVGAFDPTLRFAHHLDLWLRLLAHGAMLLESEPAIRSPRREVGNGESEATRRERAHAFVHALASLAIEDWFPELRGLPGPLERRQALIDLAVLLLGSELDEALPFAVELASRGVELGASFPPGRERARLEAVAPALFQHAPTAVTVPASLTQRSRANEPWLRIALEVRSLDRGGLENAVADLATGLRARGIEPIVVCTERGGARTADLQRAGIEVVVLDGPDRAAELAAFLESRDVHLVNAHFSTLGTALAAGLGIPVVVTLHNAYAWVGASVVDEMRRLDPLVDGYTAVSGFVADFCARRFAIARERIAVIPNAFRPPDTAVPMDRAAARAELGIPPDAELVLQIGRIDPIKCQLALVDAVEALRATRPRLVAWLVGGTGDAAYRDRVEERIARAGLGERIVLLGERSDVPRLLAAADLLAMPSVLEGLSLSVLEALAAGIPAVLTRTGDAEFLLGEKSEILPGELIDGPAVDPSFIDGESLVRVAELEHPPHAEALSAAIARVLDDLPRRSSRARVRAEELAGRLAPDEIWKEYAAVLGRSAVGGALRRAGARSDEAAALRVEIARRSEESESLRAIVAAEAESLAQAFAAPRARERALRGALSLAHDLAATQRELGATLGVMNRTLDKLRLGHRVRGALRSLIVRARGGASPH